MALLVFLTPVPATAQQQNTDTDQVNNGLVESLVPAGAQEQSTDDPSYRKSIGLTKIIVGGVGVLFGGWMLAHSEAFGYPDGLNGTGLVIGAAIAGGSVLLIRDGVRTEGLCPLRTPLSRLPSYGAVLRLGSESRGRGQPAPRIGTVGEVRRRWAWPLYRPRAG